MKKSILLYYQCAISHSSPHLNLGLNRFLCVGWHFLHSSIFMGTQGKHDCQHHQYS